jgi:hypothetical protein
MEDGVLGCVTNCPEEILKELFWVLHITSLMNKMNCKPHSFDEDINITLTSMPVMLQDNA